ncbi:amidase [Pseudaquabacterium pictum]|uniref:Amidase n=1 Tax=Pseudaquabacterium pictum TaxID=2315236 RepID=A0A480AJE1_9BURK|nr:amidase family protein [Rubrivivax pictus]GCL61661.1 amidase [Rubrivivax pictus]
MSELDLCYLPATDALHQFRSGALSPLELLQAQLRRADALEPTVNALAARRTDAALAAARAAEQTYLRHPDCAGALEGLPTVLKNEHTLVGEHTDQGSWLLGETADTENAPITQRLLDAGAVVHGRTNVPEFFVAMFTRSLRYGVTRNPWNPTYTCGGSSGGSGAALAAGITTLATGSDIGGSIRVPAAYCGVVGLKPSYGRVPEAMMFFAMNTHNHNGLLARTVGDCALMFNVINGPHRADPATIKPRLQVPLQPAPVRGLRVAVSMNLGYFDVSAEVVRNTRAAAQHLRDQGAIVEEVDLRWTAQVREAFTNGLVYTLGHSLARMIAGREDQVNDYVAAMARMSAQITLDDYLASFDVMAQMHAALQDVLAVHDVMLCPTLADNRWLAEGSDTPHDDLMQRGMTYPFNMLSRHPVLAVPSGHASHGVPTGLQIVGRTYEDARVLQVGAALEAAIGWPAWRPPIGAAAASVERLHDEAAT